MATHIYTRSHPNAENESSAVLSMVLLLAVLVWIAFYGVPVLRSFVRPQVNLPVQSTTTVSRIE